MRAATHLICCIVAGALFACGGSGSGGNSGSSGDMVSRTDAGPRCDITGCTGNASCDADSGECRPGCGSDHDCGANASCDVGTRSCACESGFHVCSDLCVSNDSVQSCGQSCTRCPDQSLATVSCDDGACRYTCVSGATFCGGACVACPTNGVTRTACSGTDCLATACSPGYRLCDGVCSACPSDGVVDTVCEANRCVATACNAGYVGCAGGCVACGPTDRFCCVETLDTGTGSLGAGRFASVAAADGTVALAYRDDAFQSARVASRAEDGGAWEIETASGPGDQGQETSVAVGDDGTLYAVWYDAVALTYDLGQKPPGGAWSVEAVAPPDTVAMPGKASLRLNSMGAPCVAYANGDTLWYAERGSSGWAVVEIDSTAGTEPALALDANGDPHISYSVSPDQASRPAVLKYAVRTSGSWTGANLYQAIRAELIESAIAVEPSGQVDVLFFDVSTQELVLESLPSGSGTWSSTKLANGTFGGLSLALDGAGTLHGSYIDAASGAVLFATWSSGLWSTLTVASAFGLASYTALTFGNSPRPYLAWWQDNPEGRLLLAH